MELMESSIDKILKNIDSAKDNLDEKKVDDFLNTIIEADNVFLIGAGRSGLVAKAFAMRLMHLGINVYVVGETITPAINKGDCIVAISGSGETGSIISAVKVAKEKGSKVLSLTSYGKSSLGKLSDTYILVEGRLKVDDNESYIERQIRGTHRSLTPLGTLFELTSLIFLDGLISELMYRLNKAESDLKKRHTVFE